LELDGEIRVEAVCAANYYRLGQQMKSLLTFGIAKKTERRPARARRRRLGVTKGHGQDACLNSILIAIKAGDRFVFGCEEQRFADHRARQREGFPIESFAELAGAPPGRPIWCEHQLADDPQAFAIPFRAQGSDQSNDLVLRYGGRDDELFGTPYIRRQSDEILLISRIEDSCARSLRGNSRVEGAAARRGKEPQQALLFRRRPFAFVEGAAEMRERADLRDDHGVDGFHPERTISHPAKSKSLSYQFYSAVAMLTFANQTIVYKNNFHQLLFQIDGTYIDMCPFSRLKSAIYCSRSMVVKLNTFLNGSLFFLVLSECTHQQDACVED
ncbi:MAG: hypothetical protein WBX30_03725, partial [Stellaceae bacterium]